MRERGTEVLLSALPGPLVLPGEVLAAAWTGPAGLTEPELGARIAQALDTPLGYPALRQNVVPGDRVLFLIDRQAPGWPAILTAMIERLLGAGVAAGDMSALGAAGEERPGPAELPGEVAWLTQAPDDRAHLAYLANTRRGRRVYLNRDVVDADVVLPIGRLWHDPTFGLRGPWSVLFPDSSSDETRRVFRSGAGSRPARPVAGVGTVVGARLEVAVLPGATGVADVIAGDVGGLVDAGQALLETRWSFVAPARADLVIVGVGEPNAPGGWEELTRALEAAHELVAHGGRIAVASRVAEAPGAALEHLAEADEPAEALRSLATLRDEPDYRAAVRLARRDRSVPVALLSDLPDTTVEDLGFVPLSGFAEIEKLAGRAKRALVVNRAELTTVRIDPNL